MPPKKGGKSKGRESKKKEEEEEGEGERTKERGQERIAVPMMPFFMSVFQAYAYWSSSPGSRLSTQRLSVVTNCG